MNAIRQSAYGPKTGSRTLPSFGISADRVTLILDIRGYIPSCGMTAERLLGHSRAALCGRPISQFVAGFAISQASQSYCARYFAHLCADRAWQVFDVIADNGDVSAVELNFSRIGTVAGRDFVFVKMRRRDDSYSLQPVSGSPPQGLPSQ